MYSNFVNDERHKNNLAQIMVDAGEKPLIIWNGARRQEHQVI